MNDDTNLDLERARATTRLCNHYWLVAAKEALQGDLGKLRKHVALAEGRSPEDVVADMATRLAVGHAELDGSAPNRFDPTKRGFQP